MVKTIQTIAAVIFDRNRYYSFLILKKKGKWTGWQFVQGEKEKDEEWETAVKREVKEETGLADIKIIKKLDIKADYWFVWEREKIHKFLAFFLVKADKNQKIKLSVEHSDYKWCGYEEALKSLKYNKEQFRKAFNELKKIKK